ncbi:Bifunctional dehydrogenase and ferrochelatase, partial [Kappamyces sp. JEL0680]
LCDFYFMAQCRFDQLQIAVSTNGGGPRLGARIRNDIVAALDSSVPKAVVCTGQIRSKIRAVDEEERRSTGPKALLSRMGWVSRFCDSWTYDQLAALEDPRIAQDVVDAFRNGNPSPTPPFAVPVSFDDAHSIPIPPQLTSYWWCPSFMGTWA